MTKRDLGGGGSGFLPSEEYSSSEQAQYYYTSPHKALMGERRGDGGGPMTPMGSGNGCDRARCFGYHNHRFPRKLSVG